MSKEYTVRGTKVYYDVIPENKKGNQISKLRKGFDFKVDAKKYGEELVRSKLAVRSRLVTFTASGMYLGDMYYPRR